MSNGEAEIVAEKEGKFSCAVSPNPIGRLVIPSILGDVNVARIAKHALLNCQEMTAVSIPSSVRTIGTCAFKNCNGLTTVTLPANVSSFGWAVFACCHELKQINVEVGNRFFASADGVLYTKDLTELVACPNGLTSVNISQYVQNVGKCAFEGCDRLRSLSLPKGVVNIGKDAFLNCQGLAKVKMYGECPIVSNNVFRGCGNLKLIHVPTDCKSWAGMKEWQGIPLVFDAK